MHIHIYMYIYIYGEPARKPTPPELDARTVDMTIT